MKKIVIWGSACLLLASLPLQAAPRDEGPVYEACHDLMLKLMDRYGRAPVCNPFLDGNGNSTSEMVGAIGLTDDGVNNWMVIRIQANAGSDSYRYNPQEINQVAYMIQSQGRGLTVKGQVLLGIKKWKDDVIRSHNNGTLDDAIYNDVMKTIQKSETDTLNEPESTFVVRHN